MLVGAGLVIATKGGLRMDGDRLERSARQAASVEGPT
jgi:hypothetical protein